MPWGRSVGSACRVAWDKIFQGALDARTKPCKLAGLRPRLGRTLIFQTKADDP